MKSSFLGTEIISDPDKKTLTLQKVE
jgi:hypothetical protein